MTQISVSLLRRGSLASIAALVVFGAGCAGNTGGDNGGSGAGAADGLAGTDGAVAQPDGASQDTTSAKADGDAGTVAPDGTVATDAGSDTANDAGTGTDASGDSGSETATPDDIAIGTDAVAADVPTGCKEDKDCPAPTAACTVAVCDAASGKCSEKAAADAAVCDDKNACTDKDACKDGKCAGTAKDCDDKNECTEDSCDPATGCVNAPNTAQCSDGDACTLADACKDGKCASGPADKCDDGNPCTDDTCGVLDATKGTKGCDHKQNTAACEDGSKCTSGDVCAAGLCTAGTPTDCDDKNSCTVDSCDAKSGCAHSPKADALECDDGNACTGGDNCSGGKCTGQAVKCDDKNPCTADSCDIAKGCTAVNDDKATCDDGNSCTNNDACKAGACTGVGKICADDGNPCTDEKCADNACSSVANAAPCDDGNPCTQKDVCKDKACGGGVPILCDDKNVCTTDTCVKETGTCQFVDNTLPCDDDSKCTSNDKCLNQTCVGAPVKCDDGKQCTLDQCDDATGNCASSPFADGTLCDDGTVCTQNDACKAGDCAGAKLNCDDGNPCTDDVCDATKGCTNVANTAKCEDGNKCTLGDVCANKECKAGTTLDKCDDNNVCTTDTCDALTGCDHNVNGNNCDDANACTANDVCKNGACAGTAKVCNDSNPCTDDSCDKTKGCVATNNTADCTDNNVCTSADKCNGGKCAGTPNAPCDDKNTCTTDSCDPTKGCVFAPANAGAACDDGSGCTTGDKCDANGKCTGVGKNCDDGNPCTDDGCANNICSYTKNTKPCTDNNACTLTDACDGAGNCKGTGALNCNDSNPCTDDSCDPAKGCLLANNTVACDDGNFCTDKDTCAGGKCANTVPHNCDDANVCTNDSCDSVNKKCVNANNTAACSDNDPCTPSDTCAAGKCVAGAPKVCDDGNPCTNDSCDKANGNCVFALTTDTVACPLFKLPATFPVDFNDPLWVNAGGTAKVKWATDASPAAPGKLTGAASLNLNDGTTYGDGTLKVAASGYGKFFVDATAYTGAQMTLSFYSYLDVQEAGIDKGFVEVSADGFATNTSFPIPAVKAWSLLAFDVKAMIGKKFQVRFRFDTQDGIGNTGAGWFVDQINLYGGPIVAITPTAWWTEPFENNSNGWQFSAPNGNGTGFAIDASPDIVSNNVTVASKISLNMNNGTDFSGLAQATALAPVIDLTNAGGGAVTLMFKEYFDTETGGFYDLRWVDVTGDAFVTLPVSSQLSSLTQRNKTWAWSWVDLTGLKGKKVQLRFRFDSKDSAANNGKGWFVDNLSLDTAPAPSYAETVSCTNISAFTIANANSTGWAVDANAGDAFYSGDCSLNFSTLIGSAYNFSCPAGATKVQGTAKSATFVVKASGTAGAKSWLRFKSYFAGELGTSYDKIWVVVQEIGGTATAATYTPDKNIINGKWAEIAFDISAFNGKTVQLIFNFDSGDCIGNTGLGWFVDDIMVRPDI